jgi:hypothetical protein
MEFNPPIRERENLELIAIAYSNTDYWQQEAIDQAKKELNNRGITEEYQLKINTDGIFNRFVTVFANRARHVSGELSLGRETEAI